MRCAILNSSNSSEKRSVPEETFDEVLGVDADIAPFGFRELILAGSNALLHARRDGRSVVGVEGWIAAEQNVSNDSQRPEIARLVVLLRAENLRRHVVRRIARRLQLLAAANLLSEAEIGQL